jgi:ABC-3C biological conflict system middle component
MRADRALIGIGAEILQQIKRPLTVSALWDTVRTRRASFAPASPVAYEWFVLALDLLFLMGAIELERGLLRRARQ